MANDLLNQLTQSQEVTIDDLVEDKPTVAKIVPEASEINRAALTSLLSEDVANNYRDMREEVKYGVSSVRDSIMKKALVKKEGDDKQGLVSLLADPSVSIETKKAAILNINSDFSKDTGTLVAMEAAKHPSGKENPEAEAVRINAAELFKPIREARENEQRLINQAYVKTNPKFTSLFGELAEQTLAPFGINKMGLTVLHQIANEMGIKTSKAGAFALPGSVIRDIKEGLSKLPADQLIAMQNLIAKTIQDEPRLIFTNDNQYAKAQLTELLISGKEYGTFDKIVDNTVGILDVFGVGSALRSGVKQVTKLFKKSPETDVRNLEMRSVTGQTSPIAPINVLTDTNPDKARTLYTALVKSEGDEVSKAITGTSRDEAVASMNLPQPVSADGAIKVKLIDPERNIRELEIDKGVVETVKATEDALRFTKPELKGVETKFLSDLQAVKGLTIHDNLVSAGVVNDKKVIHAVYGTPDGGFLKAEEALNQARFSLKDLAVSDESITLLKREGDNYIPVTLDEVKGVDGDYLIRVDAEDKITSQDILEWSPLSVKRNMFDRIPLFRFKDAGTIANTLMPNATMLSKTITGPASVAVNRSSAIEKKFVEMHKKFTDKFSELPEGRKDKVLAYLKEANYTNKSKTDVELVADGFVREEIDTINQFKKNWDTHYWFENADVVTGLKHQGYGKLVNPNGDDFILKAVPKNQNLNVYDPSTGKMGRINPNDLDDIYNQGGTIAKLRRPEDLNGATLEYVVVRNTPTEYIRALTDNDQVLNYLEGYYHRAYTGKKFIVETVEKSDGTKYEKAREIADTTEEAEQLIARLARIEGKSPDVFRNRADIKELKTDTDAYWDLMSQQGRITQRVRGEALTKQGSYVGNVDSKYVLDPIESAVRASASLANRIAMRDTLEVAKNRALDQYGEFFPSNGMGGKAWVSDDASLVPHATAEGKNIGDARTTVHYLNYLSEGYKNSLDVGFKHAMNMFANMATKVPMLEKGLLHLGDFRPVSTAKSGVMTAYLSLAPIRQFLIQSHQTVRLAGYNPEYIFSGRLIKDSLTYSKSMLSSNVASLSKEDKELIDFVKNSGSLDVVDKHNLVRGILTDMESNSNSLIKGAAYTASIPRRVGFDSGERTSKLFHLLAVRDKFKSQGKDITNATVKAEMVSVADAMTYGMNFAGDMPYNQNSLGLFMQFLQAPHKAATTMFDRRIPAADRRRMALMDMMLFGLPGSAAISTLVGNDVLPKDPEYREAVKDGIVSYAYNQMLTQISDGRVDVDFSSLSPFGMEGFAKLIHSAVEGGMTEAMQNSPAFSLYLKEGGKIQEALGRSFRYLGVLPTAEGMHPEEAADVTKAWLEVSSGISHAMKAKIILETGKIPDKSGDGTLMDNANWAYAVMQLAGFSSKKEVYEYAVLKEGGKAKKEYEKELEEVYKGYSRILTRDYKLSTSDPEFQIKVAGAFKSAFKGDYQAEVWLGKRLARDMADKDNTIMRNIIEYGNYPSEATYDAAINDLRSLGDPNVEASAKLMDHMKQAAEKQKEKK